MGAWDKDSRNIEYCPSCGAYIPSKAVRCLSCGAVTERGKKYGEGKYNPRTGTVTGNGVVRDNEGNIPSVPDEDAIAFTRLMRELAESHRREVKKLREQQNADTTSVDLDLDNALRKQFFTAKFGGEVKEFCMSYPVIEICDYLKRTSLHDCRQALGCKMKVSFTTIER